MAKVSQTTNEVLYDAFKGTDGAVAANILARMAFLFLDQQMLDPKQMAEANLVKDYLRHAGFKLVLVQEAQPLKEEPVERNPLSQILKNTVMEGV